LIEPELETWIVDNLYRQGRVIGHGYQAIVRELASPAGRLVIKSPHSNAFLAWFGNGAIRREAQVYDRLAGIPGIPRSYGLVSNRHLVLEHIDGPTLRSAASKLTDRERFFARLKATVQAMHAAGIAHSDLKRKENIVVGPDETPFLIDFGIAAAMPRIAGIRIGPGFATARQMDWNAWIKLKHGGRMEPLPADDAELYRPLLIERWARRLRGPWKTLSMRKLRKRRQGRQ